MKAIRKKLLALSILTAFLIGGCVSQNMKAAPATSNEPLSESESSPEYDITLMAVGDNLMHMGVVSSGKQEDGSLDYTFLYDGISEFLQKPISRSSIRRPFWAGMNAVSPAIPASILRPRSAMPLPDPDLMLCSMPPITRPTRMRTV